MQSKINILFIIDKLEIGGTENQLIEIIKQLNNKKFEIHLCCLSPSIYRRELDINCKKLIFNIKSIFSLNAIKYIIKLRKYINDEKIDIIQTFFLKSLVFGVLVRRCSKTKKIVHFNRDLGLQLNRFNLIFYRIMSRFIDYFLSNSQSVKDALMKNYLVENSKISIIYNGIDLTKYKISNQTIRNKHKKRLGIATDKFIIGMISNLRPEKGVEYFIQTAKLILDKMTNVQFIIIGDGILKKEIKTLIRELDISKNLLLIEGCSNILNYLYSFDIGVLSSISEGFSNVILEYMAAAIPIVATNIGGNSEQIINYKSGILVRPKMPKLMANVIINLLFDEKLRNRLGRNARKYCEEKFRIESMILNLENYYSLLL